MSLTGFLTLLPEARRIPFGSKVRQVTADRWPLLQNTRLHVHSKLADVTIVSQKYLSVTRHVYSSMSQSRMLPSSYPVASLNVEELSARDETSCLPSDRFATCTRTFIPSTEINKDHSWNHDSGEQFPNLSTTACKLATEHSQISSWTGKQLVHTRTHTVSSTHTQWTKFGNCCPLLRF